MTDGMLRFEGVTFIVENCIKMTKDQFVKKHVGVFWQDRDEATRKKMLAEAYSKMQKPGKSKDETEPQQK